MIPMAAPARTSTGQCTPTFRSKDIISEKSAVVKPDTILSDHFPICAKFLIPEKINQANR